MFEYGQAAGIRLIILVALSAIIMTLDHRHHYIDGVRSTVAVVLYPIQMLVSFPSSAGNWMSENLVSRETLLSENETLKSQNTLLQAQMQKFIAVEVENMRLRKLLDASETVGERILASELLSVDLDPFSHKVQLDKGSSNDLYEGQPLIDAEGIYGQVIYATPFSSTAMLITDPSHALPVQLVRTGLRAIAAGTGQMDQLNLLHIPNNADIRPGDKLVTSGLGGVFPSGYPVAEVISIEPDPSQPYATVTARPTAALDRSRHVLLVWNRNTDKRAKAEPQSQGHVQNPAPQGAL